MRFQQDDQVAEIGDKKNVPTNFTDNTCIIILPVEEVNEPYLISSVGVDYHGIFSLQMNSAIDCSPEDVPRHLYSYGHSKVGVVMLDKHEEVIKRTAMKVTDLEV